MALPHQFNGADWRLANLLIFPTPSNYNYHRPPAKVPTPLLMPMRMLA